LHLGLLSTLKSLFESHLILACGFSYGLLILSYGIIKITLGLIASRQGVDISRFFWLSCNCLLIKRNCFVVAGCFLQFYSLSISIGGSLSIFGIGLGGQFLGGGRVSAQGLYPIVCLSSVGAFGRIL